MVSCCPAVLLRNIINLIFRHCSVQKRQLRQHMPGILFTMYFRVSFCSFTMPERTAFTWCYFVQKVSTTFTPKMESQSFEKDEVMGACKFTIQRHKFKTLYYTVCTYFTSLFLCITAMYYSSTCPIRCIKVHIGSDGTVYTTLRYYFRYKRILFILW